MLKLNKNKNGIGSYSFSEDNYNAGLCGQGHTLTKSFTQGDPTYDAARANMGEIWMMPTYDQCEELINNTTYTWANMSMIFGMKFTSNIDPSKYIYLLASGYWRDTSHSYKNKKGNYWSIIHHDTSTFNSWYLIFNSSNVFMDYSGYRPITYGYSIRPIAPPRPW